MQRNDGFNKRGNFFDYIIIIILLKLISELILISTEFNISLISSNTYKYNNIKLIASEIQLFVCSVGCNIRKV